MTVAISALARDLLMKARSRSRWFGRLPARCLAVAVCSAGLLFGGGCVATGPWEYIHNGFKVGPNYATPPAPVADNWIDANNPGIQNRHIPEWWNVFQDPVLTSLIDGAYDQNLTLRAAGTRILQARAQLAIA